MPNDLIPFGFEGTNVRVHVDTSGEPWWIAADVCRVLSIANVSQAVSRLKSDEISTLCFSEGGQPRTFNLVNEQGLYRLIFRSNPRQ